MDNPDADLCKAAAGFTAAAGNFYGWLQPVLSFLLVCGSLAVIASTLWRLWKERKR